MTTRQKPKRLSEAEIDDLVVAHADDDSAWEEPVTGKPLKWRTVRLPEELAARVAYFAMLHDDGRIDDWIRRVLLERLEQEEAVMRR